MTVDSLYSMSNRVNTYINIRLQTHTRNLVAQPGGQRKCINTLVAQISQCTSPISHNASFCNRSVHISVTKWCIKGYLSDALWTLWAGSNRPIYICKYIYASIYESIYVVHSNKYGHVQCFVVIRYRWDLPIFFRVTLLALGQSYDCPSSSEATSKNMDQMKHYELII